MRTAPISVILPGPGRVPVVSRSTTTKATSARSGRRASSRGGRGWWGWSSRSGGRPLTRVFIMRAAECVRGPRAATGGCGAASTKSTGSPRMSRRSYRSSARVSESCSCTPLLRRSRGPAARRSASSASSPQSRVHVVGHAFQQRSGRARSARQRPGVDARVAERPLDRRLGQVDAALGRPAPTDPAGPRLRWPARGRLSPASATGQGHLGGPDERPVECLAGARAALAVIALGQAQARPDLTVGAHVLVDQLLDLCPEVLAAPPGRPAVRGLPATRVRSAVATERHQRRRRRRGQRERRAARRLRRAPGELDEERADRVVDVGAGRSIGPIRRVGAAISSASHRLPRSCKGLVPAGILPSSRRDTTAGPSQTAAIALALGGRHPE